MGFVGVAGVGLVGAAHGGVSATQGEHGRIPCTDATPPRWQRSMAPSATGLNRRHHRAFFLITVERKPSHLAALASQAARQGRSGGATEIRILR